LLIAIALVFFITWLPLNVLNLVIDIQNPFKLPDDEEKMVITYAVCHLFAMSSACANPFLYGWFNGNFRDEFTKILRGPLIGLLCCLNEGCNLLSSQTFDNTAVVEAAGSLSSVAFRASITSALPEQIGTRPNADEHHSSTIDITKQGMSRVYITFAHFKRR